MPDAPERRTSRFNVPALTGIRPAFHHPGDAEVFRDDEESRVEIDFGVVQPGRSVWSEPFYLMASKSREIALNGVVYSSDLLKPPDFALTVRVDVKPRNASMRQLLALADAFQSGDD